MGNYVTKYFFHNNESEKEETNVQCSIDEISKQVDIMYTSPICRTTLSMDPRSITIGIDRTPIEVHSTPIGLNKRTISAVPKHLHTKPYLETDMDKVIPLTPNKCVPRIVESKTIQFLDGENKNTDSPVTPTVNNLNVIKRMTSIEKERYDILGLDPRSPAANFDRTPILPPKSIQRLKARSQECLHRQGSYETDVLYPRLSYCEMLSQFNIPEIQALPDLTAERIEALNFHNSDDSYKSNDSNSSYSTVSSKNKTSFEIENQMKSEETTSNQNIDNVEQPKEINIVNNDAIKIWRDSLVSSVLGKSEIKIATDEKKNGNECTKIRPPLGNRSNNGRTQVSINSPQTFKNKNIMPKMQENTPPHKRCVARAKLNGMQWDPDSSVII
ncbi:uncharacterized protein LOC122396290 [Colletes gigas]|uniref:uncharacterized protein LOC122396290 n=1 Tax=Colletes gigas TaxID=935657 RepID=UPI001C9BB927|nr:uncharacterized protein LOC122396290 [Colletes gigas]XP_043250476.1 uncharacterized protein LOC122396290 [Colletes gigas]XP_043250477.1 uncharacterized protein LOC122396290 [Colletes gigas]